MMNKQELKIGDVIKFDYVSSTNNKKEKDFTDPVLVYISEELKQDIIQTAKSNREELEERFSKLYDEAEEIRELLELLEEEKSSRDGRKKSHAEKELEEAIKKSQDNILPKKKGGSTTKSDPSRFFFRQYKPENMLDGDSNEAVLVNKDVSKKGEPIYRFIVLNQYKKVEKDQILPEEAEDVTADDNLAIELVSKFGQLELVKLLAENDDKPIRWFSLNGR